MAGIDPTLVFQENTPLQYRAANNASALSQAETTGVGLENTQRQQAIDLQTMAINAQKTWDRLVAENMEQVPNNPDEQMPPSGPAPTTGQPDGQSAPTQAPGLPGETPPAIPASGTSVTPATTPSSPSAGLPGEMAPPGLPDESHIPGSGVDLPPGLPPGGTHMVTHWDAVLNGMNAAGYSTAGIAGNKQLQESLKVGLDNHNLSLEADQKRNELMGAALSGLPPVDTAASPDIQNVQKQQWQSAAMNALQLGLKQGWIDPQYEQALAQQVSDGWNPEVDAQVKGIAGQAKGYAANIEAHINDQKAAQAAILTGTTIEENRGKIARQDLETQTQTVRGVTDADSLQAWFDRAPKSVQEASQPIYQNPDLTTKQKVEQIAGLGLTEEQRTRDKEADARLAESQYQHDIVNSQRDERQYFLEGQKEAGRNIDKAQAGRDYSELVKLQDQERKLGDIRTRLGQQLQNANAPVIDPKTGRPDPTQKQEFQYIQENGSTKPSSLMRDPKTKKPDPKEVTAAISDMQSRYDAATQSLKEIVNQKYDITKDTGKVSREQALAAYDNPASTTPATKSSSGPPVQPVAAQPGVQMGNPQQRPSGLPSPDLVDQQTTTKSTSNPNAPPVSLLKEGKVTVFKNGQKWALRNGVAVKVY